MLAVLAVGAFVSINLLFKVTIFRVENYDRSQPVDTGIYTSDELIKALGISRKTPICSPSPPRKRPSSWRISSRIWSSVAVEIQMPAAVIIKVEPAAERFACMYSGGLDGLERLPQNSAHRRQPAGRPDSADHVAARRFLPPWWGRTSSPRAITRCLAGPSRPQRRQQVCRQLALQTLTEMRDGLQANNLFDGTTALNIRI